jgi:hypothetical protein
MYAWWAMARWKRLASPRPASHITQEMNAADQGSDRRDPSGAPSAAFWRPTIIAASGVTAQ